MSPLRQQEIDVTPEAVAARGDDVQLVDVREAYEWEAGRIEGARHLELARLAAEAETLDRDRPLFVYCRVGGRSGMAAQALRRAGFDAYSMAGGLVRWDAEGRPLTPEGGSVADH